MKRLAAGLTFVAIVFTVFSLITGCNGGGSESTLKSAVTYYQSRSRHAADERDYYYDSISMNEASVELSGIATKLSNPTYGPAKEKVDFVRKPGKELSETKRDFLKLPTASITVLASGTDANGSFKVKDTFVLVKSAGTWKIYTVYNATS